MAESKPHKGMKAKTGPTSEKTANKQPKKSNLTAIFFGFWGVILVVIAIAVIGFGLDPIAFLVWFIVVAISGAVTLSQSLQQWEGKVERLETVTETRGSGDDDYEVQVTYAYVRLIDGKLKKVHSGGWSVGDHLKKVRGEMTVQVLNK